MKTGCLHRVSPFHRVTAEPVGVLTSVVLSPAVEWDSSILNRIVVPFATWWVSLIELFTGCYLGLSLYTRRVFLNPDTSISPP